MHIAREVEVDVLHGDYLSVAAARSTALDAENGAERGLTQSEHSLLAYLAHSLGETDADSSLALACGSGIYRGNENELAVLLECERGVEALGQLSLVVSVGLEELVADAEVSGYLADLFHFRVLCDLNIR